MIFPPHNTAYLALFLDFPLLLKFFSFMILVFVMHLVFNIFVF